MYLIENYQPVQTKITQTLFVPGSLWRCIKRNQLFFWDERAIPEKKTMEPGDCFLVVETQQKGDLNVYAAKILIGEQCHKVDDLGTYYLHLYYERVG